MSPTKPHIAPESNADRVWERIVRAALAHGVGLVICYLSFLCACLLPSQPHFLLAPSRLVALIGWPSRRSDFFGWKS